MKTGFRRFIYGYKPPLEKETKIERRKDELRYPWASRDNIYRAPRKNKNTPKQKNEGEEEKEEDHYPEYDPMGLYRPREKRHHIKLEDVVLPKEKYADRSTYDLLSNLRAKTNALAATQYKDGEDIDAFVQEISRPITRSGPVDIYVPVTEGEYVFADREELNPDINRKIRESRAELDEFNRLLDKTFKPRPVTARPRPQPTTTSHGNPYMNFDDEVGVNVRSPVRPQPTARKNPYEDFNDEMGDDDTSFGQQVNDVIVKLIMIVSPLCRVESCCTSSFGFDRAPCVHPVTLSPHLSDPIAVSPICV